MSSLVYSSVYKMLIGGIDKVNALRCLIHLLS
jgi:hypothetical protein